MNFITKRFKKHKITTILDPFVVQYTNPTDKKLTAIMFGYNDFAHQGGNFGNGELIVTNLQVSHSSGYTRLISQSGLKPFVYSRIRIQSKNEKTLGGTLFINHRGGDGNEKRIAINLGNYKDAYQFQSDVIDLRRNEATLDGNTYWELDIEPNANAVISVYPQTTKLVSYKKYKQYLRSLENDRLHPIIIQTVGAVAFVKFINKVTLFFSNLKQKFSRKKATTVCQK